MPEQINELKIALAMLSRLTVSGDAVDIMAAAKSKIRKVIEDLSKREETNNGNG